MTKEQVKILNMLQEIDGICRDKGIEYTLTERTAAMAVLEGRFTCYEYCADIAMTGDQYKKFLAEFSTEKLSGRTIETLENNVKMDGVYARYVDTETTLWDIEKGSHYECKGMYVNIRILRPGTSEGKKNKRVEQMIRNNGRDALAEEIKYGTGDYKKKSQMLRLTRILYRRKGTLKKYWNNSIGVGAADKCFYYAGKSKRIFEGAWLKEFKDIEFEGTKLRIVNDTDALLKMLYGSKVKEAIAETEQDLYRFGVIADADVPYAETMKEIEEQGLYTAEDEAAYRDFAAYENRYFIPRKQLVEKHWAYVRRTIDRISLFQELDGKEEKIHAMYQEGRKEEVRAALARYMELIEQNAKLGLGFCIDKELFDIACELMCEEGKERIVDKARKLMPEEFKESMRDFLVREGCPAVKK